MKFHDFNFFLRFGERFPSMNNCYNKELRQLAKNTSNELNFSSFVQEGVYACVGGPSFETTAELNFLHSVRLETYSFFSYSKVHFH